MLFGHIRRRCLPIAAAVVLAVGASGCSEAGASGASSPEAAVERFLAPFSQEREPSRGSSASEDVKEFWASTCDLVDPEIRSQLRFDEDQPDSRVNCGAVVVLHVLYTGDTGRMRPPSKVSGKPVAAETSGDQSVVDVELRYESAAEGSSSPAPPAKATVKVLVVKRDGSWWVATPQAFNAVQAAEGGYDESELRSQYEQLLNGKAG